MLQFWIKGQLRGDSTHQNKQKSLYSHTRFPELSKQLILNIIFFFLV